MSRIFVSYIIPFILPAATYAAWVWYRTRYADRHGGEVPTLEKGPWPLLLFIGAVFAFAVLGTTAMLSGGSPDQTYVPPRVENGTVIPGHLEPKKP
jgi:hypothetical protein